MNNKIKRLLIVFILGIFIVIPITNAKAATSVKEGIYFEQTKEFYTVSQLNGLSIAKIGALFSQNKLTQIYLYFPGVGVASLQQANQLGLISAANANGNKNNPENIIPQGNYKDVNGNTVPVNGNAVTEEFKIIGIE